MSEQEPVDMVCSAFGIARSSYYEHRRSRSRIDVERLEQRAKVNALFTQSRSSAGSRTIMTQMQDEDYEIGRFRVRRLMREVNLTCK